MDSWFSFVLIMVFSMTLLMSLTLCQDDVPQALVDSSDKDYYEPDSSDLGTTTSTIGYHDNDNAADRNVQEPRVNDSDLNQCDLNQNQR